MATPTARVPSDERFAAQARLVGIRNFTTPSLEAVERRRSELWTMAFLAMVGLAVAVVLVSLTGDGGGRVVRSVGFRIGLVAFTVAIAAYVLEKERHLRRLTRLLMDERVLTAALSNRITEVSMLCEVGKAVNSVLDLDQVLAVILRSATDLLHASSGSLMLVDEDSPGVLRVACELGNPTARDAVVPMGEGVAGHVALLREPMLISGTVERRDRPVDSAMCVPLVNRDETLGVLNLNATADRSFTEYDLRALTLFAEQAAIAIANARLYEAERGHVAKLLELDRMKSEFVATVSHELRTPLTSILGCVRTLKRKKVPPEVATEFLDMIDRQGNRLLHLIEEVLEAQRSHDGDRMPLAPVDLADVLDEVVRMQETAGREVAFTEPPPLDVLGDRPSLERVFTNLIDNGMTHGGGKVEVEVEETTQDGVRVAVVCVLDRGPGVDPADTERIFERFHRGRETTAPGMGLGLHMVRSLVEAQGGRVWVEPRHGGGAVFKVLLPCVPQG